MVHSFGMKNPSMRSSSTQGAEYLKEHKPRVLFVSGENDDWTQRRLSPMLKCSAPSGQLHPNVMGKLCRAMPEYRGRTTLVFSPGHGRGSGRRNWRDHGDKILDSKIHLDGVSRSRLDMPKAGPPFSDVILH